MDRINEHHRNNSLVDEMNFASFKKNKNYFLDNTD